MEYEGACYHVMNRGLERKRIALKKQDHEEFVNLIKDISVHDSTIQLDKFWKIYNYSIGERRGMFYPNDNLLQKTGN